MLLAAIESVPNKDCYECNPLQPNRDKLIRPEPRDDCFHSRECCRRRTQKSIPIHRLEPSRPANENLPLEFAPGIGVRVQITRRDRFDLNRRLGSNSPTILTALRSEERRVGQD